MFGCWPIGARIPAEAELKEQLGVGRNSLREAIRAVVYTGCCGLAKVTGPMFVLAAD